MKTSIAMATYNGAKYLKEQLDSFVVQNYLPDELIVCDDGSKDDTLTILEQFKKAAPFSVRIYHNSEILGHTKNFSKAIGLCQGDIILLSDQDDVWLPTKIKSVLATFSENPNAAYVFSDAILVDENLAPIGNLWEQISFIDARYRNYVDGNQVETILRGGNFVYGNSLAFRASLRELILPIDSTSWSIAHDTWISLLLSSVGAQGVTIQDALLLYRQHTHQVTDESRKKSLKGVSLTVRQNKMKYFLEKAVDVRSIRDRAIMTSVISVGLLDEYISHLETRASLYSIGSLLKINTIYLEFKSGRYKRFSSSLKSVFKDLFFT